MMWDLHGGILHYMKQASYQTAFIGPIVSGEDIHGL